MITHVHVLKQRKYDINMGLCGELGSPNKWILIPYLKFADFMLIPSIFKESLYLLFKELNTGLTKRDTSNLFAF